MLRKRSNLSQQAQRGRLKQEFQPPPASSICVGDEDQPVGFSISSAAANDRVCSWRFLQRLYNILWSSTLFITIYEFWSAKYRQFQLRGVPDSRKLSSSLGAIVEPRFRYFFKKCPEKTGRFVID